MADDKQPQNTTPNTEGFFEPSSPEVQKAYADAEQERKDVRKALASINEATAEKLTDKLDQKTPLSSDADAAKAIEDAEQSEKKAKEARANREGIKAAEQELVKESAVAEPEKIKEAIEEKDKNQEQVIGIA